MAPGGYDAVLVDARLGSERGIDLVNALLLEDPAAAARCLVMTGGAIDALPDGVACLAKPFQLDELLATVHALHQPDTSPAPARLPKASSSHPQAAAPPGNTGSATVTPPAWLLLGATRRLRAYERRQLIDFLHDGPIQEIAAATLELHMMSRLAPAGPEPRFEMTMKRLDAAAASLRWLIEGQSPFLAPGTPLTTAIPQRIAWLLAAPVTVDTDPPTAQLNAVEVPELVDIVELMLLGVAPDCPHARAHVAVRTQPHEVHVELTLTAAGHDSLALGDPAAAQAALSELADALGTSAQAEFRGRHWQARIVLPRQRVSSSDREI